MLGVQLSQTLEADRFRVTVTTHAAALSDRLRVAGLRAVLRIASGFGSGPEARPAFDRYMFSVPSPERVRYEPAVVGGVAGWWCLPEAAEKNAVILYLHGGAYVLGTAAAYRHFVGHVAAASGMPAFVADYALAPERPFPAALDDAMSAYRALALGEHAVVIVGDSAGGGLCLALGSAVLAAAKSEDLPSPLGMAAFSPWTDLALTGESLTSRAHRDPLLTRDVLAACAAQYLQGHDAHDPHASPLYGNFDGGVPVLIHVGTDEVLLDDSLRVAERIGAAGSTVEVHVWRGMTHVFLTNRRLRAASKALQLYGEFFRNIQPK